MGVRDRSAVLVPRRIFNRCTGFIFAQGILLAAVAAVALLTRFARNPTAAGLAIHQLKSISNFQCSFSSISGTPKIWDSAGLERARGVKVDGTQALLGSPRHPF